MNKGLYDWNVFKYNNNDHLNILNKLNSDIYYQKNEKMKSSILKIFYNKFLFDKELYIHVQLKKMDLKILPNIINVEYNKSKHIIEYDFTDLIPLRNVLQLNNINSHFIINELLSFITSIQFKQIRIHNLNVNNIYINLNTMKFYILNSCDIKIAESEYELDVDLKSLYNSLQYTNIKNKTLKYINQEFDNIIKQKCDELTSSHVDNIIDLYST